MARIRVTQAARLMQVCDQFVRVGMQRNLLDIGTAIQISGKRYTYHISPGKLANYLGISIDELERNLKVVGA